MEKRNKIIFIVVGSLLLTGALGMLIYWAVNKESTVESEEPDENPDVSKGSMVQTENWGGGSSNESDAGSSWGDTPDSIIPTYDTENQLSNPLSELKGRALYPKREWIGGLGYANVRSSAEVDDIGLSQNKITTINSGVPIGKVIEEVAGEYNGFSYRWFRVKLFKPVSGWFSNYQEGYVRADTVTIKPYTI